MKPIVFLCSLAFSLFFSIPSQAQYRDIAAQDLETIQNYEDTIALLSYAIINDSIAENRFGATKKLIPTLVKALQVPNSYQYPFSKVQSISIQYPADSTFRIFTWQLYVDENDYRYYGAIQKNAETLELIPLIDRSSSIMRPEMEVLAGDRWFGALYYRIKQYTDAQGQTNYLLFGFDGYEFFNKRKLVENLSFDAAGKAVFGAPNFIENTPEGTKKTKNRLVLDYSAEASIRLNYDDIMELIVFDHLIKMGLPGAGLTNVPDGSYDGYELVDGIWTFKPKLFNQVLEEAPRPSPVLEDRGKKDIFGGKQ
ncbi:MAG: hypothetical protein AAGH79_15590 [Bacteroidota bacterium]